VTAGTPGKPVPGVNITANGLVGTVPYNLTIQNLADGTYIITVPVAFTGTVTPSWPVCRNRRYIFDPPNYSYSNVGMNYIGKDYKVKHAP